MTRTPFSTDYSSARTRFREAAAAAGANLDSDLYPVAGPDGDELTTDVAWLGAPDASRVFVTVSGTHGVEGFCGSGAQVDWLERGEANRLPFDTSALLIHAINPFGFAWLRRVTHENIDLNRNWIDFDAPLPENPEYDELASNLCPTEWTDESRARTFASLQGYAAKHGFPALVQAVSGGQYRHADGLFYGGTQPSAARATLTRIFEQRLSHAQHIGVIDYHSGLGPFGYGEAIVIEPPGGAVCARARRWFGNAVTAVGTADSVSAKVAGGWTGAMPDLLPKASVTAIGLEFGTVDPLQVLAALRADNWLHEHGDVRGPESAGIKQAMLRAFYADSDVWRGMVLGQSLAACRQAVAGLQLKSAHV